jgi:hypothetical protein
VFTRFVFIILLFTNVDLICQNNSDRIIRKILIDSRDIFEKPNTIEKVINQLHVKTFDYTIKKNLTFEELQTFDSLSINESENNLRQLGFIGNVEIKTILIEKDSIDIIISFSEKWSLQGGVWLSKNIAAYNYGFSFKEHNIIGSGVELSLSLSRDQNVNQQELIIIEPNLLGQFIKTKYQFKNELLGRINTLDLKKDYYSNTTNLMFSFYFENYHGKKYISSFSTPVENYSRNFIAFEITPRLALIDNSFFTTGVAYVNEKQDGYNKSEYVKLYTGLSFIKINHVKKKFFNNSQDFESIGEGYLISFTPGFIFKPSTYSVTIQGKTGIFLNESNYLYLFNAYSYDNLFKNSNFAFNLNFVHLFHSSNLSFNFDYERRIAPQNLMDFNYKINRSLGNEVYYTDNILNFNVEHRIFDIFSFSNLYTGLNLFFDYSKIRCSENDLFSYKSFYAIGLSITIENSFFSRSSILRIDFPYNPISKKIGVVFSINQFFNNIGNLNFYTVPFR